MQCQTKIDRTYEFGELRLKFTAERPKIFRMSIDCIRLDFRRPTKEDNTFSRVWCRVDISLKHTPDLVNESRKFYNHLTSCGTCSSRRYACADSCFLDKEIERNVHFHSPSQLEESRWVQTQSQ